MGRRILITGLAGQLQGLLARRLERRDDVEAVVGTDTSEPVHDLARTRWVEIDLRGPGVADLLERERLDTVLHLSTASSPVRTGGRARMKEHNVIGAMQLFAACQQVSGVRHVVLKSTTAVYGSAHTDPARFTEDALASLAAAGGFTGEAREIEEYLSAACRRREDLTATVLRFANLLGPGLDTSFRSLFSLPVVPTVLGYDPRLQFCHVEDALQVLERSATGGPAGVYNVAGDGVLYLSQCVRLAGRVPLPVPGPAVAGVAALVRRGRGVDVSPDQLRVLRFGRAVDTTRLHTRFGYRPRHTSRQAFERVLARPGSA